MRNFRYALVVILCGILAGCGSPGPQNIQPVTGLPGGTDGLSWWNDTIFYQIFVRSFYDSNGDGIGDFNGIIEKLDYLNDGDPDTDTDLGITGIWLMPLNPSPSYHGYDVTDYYAVNPEYGTMDDFKHLLDECHQRGIRVIMDMVLNHTSSQHPWFQAALSDPESEFRDWYIWADEDPNYNGPWNQDVWYPANSGDFYYALFWSEMPDLNYTNPAVRAEMENASRFWLEEVGVDGFRLDAAKHIIEDGQIQENTEATHAWWRQFRSMYEAINPDVLTVGEIWTTNYAVVEYLQGDELDMAFNFDLASAILNYVLHRDANNMSNSIERSYHAFPPGTYATFLTNHDQERAMSAFFRNSDLAGLAASVLLTGPGVPFIYYGEEIGMTGTKPDPNIRTPMQWNAESSAGFTSGSPWQAVNRDYAEMNVALETVNPDSLLSHYRSLIQLRNNHVALRIGEYIPVDTDSESLLAFLRVSQEEIVLVLINLGDEAANGFTLSLNTGPLTGTYWAALLLGEGEAVGLTATASGGFSDYQPFELVPANGTMVIQLTSR